LLLSNPYVKKLNVKKIIAVMDRNFCSCERKPEKIQACTKRKEKKNLKKSKFKNVKKTSQL